MQHARCRHHDTGSLDPLVGLFGTGVFCDSGAFGSWRGVEEIRQGRARRMAVTGTAGSRLHSVSNPSIEVFGDRAEDWWYLVDHDIEPDCTTPVHLLATYHDDRLRIVDGWRFRHT